MNQNSTIASLISQAIIANCLHEQGAINKLGLVQKLHDYAESTNNGDLDELPGNGAVEIRTYLLRLAEAIEST